MYKTMRVFLNINYVCLALGLFFWPTMIQSEQITAFIGITLTILFLIISHFLPEERQWIYLAYISFFIGLSGVTSGGEAFFLFIVIMLLRPPVTFLNGTIYAYWILFIVYTILSFGEIGSLSSFFDDIKYLIHYVIFTRFSFLLFLGGYITSVLPYYMGYQKTEASRFHGFTTTIVYLATFIFQLGLGIAVGLYYSLKNYIMNFKETVRLKTVDESNWDDQPADEVYWLKKSFRQLKVLMQQSLQTNKRTKEQFKDRARLFLATYGFILGAIPFTFFNIIAYSAVLFGALFLLISGLLHFLITGLIFIPFFLYFLIFYTYDSYYLRTRKITTICPSCYYQSLLPAYACPSCQRKHTYLRPGRFGLRKRLCVCGESLPTTSLDGREQLSAFCQSESCQIELHTKEMTPFTISFIGGPSVGKTSFFIAAIHDLFKHKSDHQLTDVSFIKRQDEQYVKEQMNQLAQGQFPRKTTDRQPIAYNIKLMQENWKHPKLLYFFDPAGEVYNDSDELWGHDYLESLGGYVLLIDPFSIAHRMESFHKIREEQLSALRPSAVFPEDALDLLMIHLNRKYRVKLKEKIDVPIAIVINKVDGLFNLPEIAAISVDDTPDKDEYDLFNEQCISLLEQLGYQSFVKQIQSRFNKHQFFLSSSNLQKNDIVQDRAKIITWLIEQS